MIVGVLIGYIHFLNAYIYFSLSDTFYMLDNTLAQTKAYGLVTLVTVNSQEKTFWLQLKIDWLCHLLFHQGLLGCNLKYISATESVGILNMKSSIL